MVGPSVPHNRPRWTGATWLKALVVAAWLIGCDLWIKAVATVAACTETGSVADALTPIWSTPGTCQDTDFWGIARLHPVVRESGPLGLDGMTWAYALIAIALVFAVYIVFWRWRSTGDALALGTLLGGVVIEVGPRLLHGGAGRAEFHLGGFTTGLGDIALAWALLWLAWRLIAEARA